MNRAIGKNEVSERLNQLLANLQQTDPKYSAVQLAKRIGITRQALSRYMKGERTPDAKMLKQICETCSVSADWLIGLSEMRALDQSLRTVLEYTGLNEEAANLLHDEALDASFNKPFINAANKLLGTPIGQTAMIRISRFLFSDFSLLVGIDENGRRINVSDLSLIDHRGAFFGSIDAETFASVVLESIASLLNALRKSIMEKEEE